MPTKNATTESDGFSAEERAAMKERAAELRAEGKKGAKKADGLQAVLDSDRGDGAGGPCARRARARDGDRDTPPSCRRRPGTACPPTRTRTARSSSSSRTRASSSYRYSTLGFQDAANLDDGDMWPVSYALVTAKALARHPRIDVTGFESEIGIRYTYETLSYLRRHCPGVRFVWIMGADNLRSFHRWQKWREIAAMMPIAVVDRLGPSLYATASAAGQALAGPATRNRRPARWPAAIRPPGFTSTG